MKGRQFTFVILALIVCGFCGVIANQLNQAPGTPSAPSLIEKVSTQSQTTSQSQARSQVGVDTSLFAEHNLANEEIQAFTESIRTREDTFLKVMGPEEKAKFDNVRRAGRWLFNEGRLEEGAAMYARAIEMYSTKLKEPLKEFTSYATLGTAILEKEKNRGSGGGSGGEGGSGIYPDGGSSSSNHGSGSGSGGDGQSAMESARERARVVDAATQPDPSALKKSVESVFIEYTRSIKMRVNR